MSVCVIFTCLQPLRCVLATLELRGIDDRRDALTLMLPLLALSLGLQHAFVVALLRLVPAHLFT